MRATEGAITRGPIKGSNSPMMPVTPNSTWATAARARDPCTWVGSKGTIRYDMGQNIVNAHIIILSTSLTTKVLFIILLIYGKYIKTYHLYLVAIAQYTS